MLASTILAPHSIFEVSQHNTQNEDKNKLVEVRVRHEMLSFSRMRRLYRISNWQKITSKLLTLKSAHKLSLPL